MNPRAWREQRAQRGFTLLELIVAVAVLSVLSLLAYGGLDALFRSREAQLAAAERARALELAVLRIERDLRHAHPRPVRGAYGETLPALAGSEFAAEWSVLDLEATRTGIATQGLRVGYAVSDGALWRSVDPVLDRTPRDTARRRRILDQVESIRFVYRSRGERLSSWPPRTGSSDPARLPRAVEVSLRVAGVGEIVRIIELPEAAR
jgi:general secretion pathway protein J